MGIGVPKFAKTPKVFVGVELDEPKGNCNGTLAGCTYFTCDDKYGLYQVPKNLTLAQEEVTVDLDTFNYAENNEEKQAVEIVADVQPSESQPEAEVDEKNEPQVEPEPVIESKPEVVPEQDPEPQSEAKPEPQPEPKPDPIPEPQPAVDPEPEPVPLPELEPVPEAQADPEPEPAAKPPIKSD